MTGYTSVGFGETASIPDDLFFLNPTYQHRMTGWRNYGYMWSKFGWSGIFWIALSVVLMSLFVPPFINEVRLATLPTNTTEGRWSAHALPKAQKIALTII